MCIIFFFFFFSSRRRHTRFDCDWSSDVCSSDLEGISVLASIEDNILPESSEEGAAQPGSAQATLNKVLIEDRTGLDVGQFKRSEERRVGKECRYQWSGVL